MWMRTLRIGLPLLLVVGGVACGDDATVGSSTFSGDASTSGGSSTGGTTIDSLTSVTATPTTGDPTTTGMPTRGGSSSSGESSETDTVADESSSGGVVCGDGVVEADEACDGDDLGDADCISEGFDGGELSCADDCTLVTDACAFNCGNGAIDDGEECDQLDLGGADCTTLGMRFDRGALGCNEDCTFDASACVTWECGDDMINGADVCDGTDLGGEDCISQGFDGGDLACAEGCAALDPSGCHVCGDGSIGGDEVCDGDDLDAQTCVTQGFDGGTLGCNADCGSFDTSGCYVCGDDVAGGDEVCDGDDLGGETCLSQGLAGGTLGCDADCGGFDTSMCIDQICGDGLVTGTEVCDGTEFGAVDCVSQGFLGGSLQCSANCLAIVSSGCFDTVTTVCSSPAAAIGPGPTDPLTTDTISAVGNGDALVDVDVFVDASHSWTGDLEVDITHVASGEVVRMFDNACNSSTDDDLLVTFDDGAADVPACGVPVGGGGSGLPVESLAAFDNFADGSGDWQITIADTAAGDGGTLNEWCINLGTNSSLPICGDAVIDAGEQCDTTTLNATTCEDLGFTGGSLDCAANCSFDTSECSNSVIAYCSTPGLPVPPVVNDTITVADAGTVGDVDVFVDITHTWSADLDVFLHNDTTASSAELTTDNCLASDNVFVFFNDEASLAAPDCVGLPGIEGNLIPESPLSVFDGQPIAGDWRLSVADDSVGDEGVVNEWCLYITPQ